MELKITFHPNIYRSVSITDKEFGNICKQLQRNPLFSDVYLLVPASNEKDLLEFYHSRQLVQPYYFDKEHYIIGIAKTYGEAIRLVEQIVLECLDARGDCALREYLLC